MISKNLQEGKNYTDLRNSSVNSNFFLQNYRYFDLTLKTNGTLNNITFLPEKFNSNISLPLILAHGNNTSKIKIILTCLRIIKLFTFQKSFIKKWLVFQQIKKKNSGFVLQTKTFSSTSFERFYYYILTIFPYLRVSYGSSANIFLSDILGVITFNLADITYFSNFLKEKHLDWERQFIFFFNWVAKKKISKSKKIKFFFINFIQGMVNRVLWSSLGLRCSRGHGGWVEFSKFSKTIFYENTKFFQKNFWF